MKQVPQKDLPEVSGGRSGDYKIITDPITPYYPVPIEFPQNPLGPVEAPENQVTDR